MAHFALHRRNFTPVFCGVSETILTPRKIPLWNSSCNTVFTPYFLPPEWGSTRYDLFPVALCDELNKLTQI